MSLRVKGFSDSIPISFCVHPNLSVSSLQLWEEGSKWTGSMSGLSPYCQLQAWHTESSQSSFISEWMKKWMDVTLYSKVTEITKVIPALFIFNPCAPEQQNDVKSAIKDHSLKRPPTSRQRVGLWKEDEKVLANKNISVSWTELQLRINWEYYLILISSVQLLSRVQLFVTPWTRPPCPSPTPGVYPNSCPLSWWCHPAISSSVIPFSFCPQSFPASGSFQMSQLFISGGQSIGVSASTSVLPMNTQDWSPFGLTGWISLLSKEFSRVFSNTIVQKHQFFGAQLSL